jgi:flavin-dependent dehydrogenase
VTIPDLHSRLWDAAVIGAGPAGTIAARLLAAAGASVLLVDRGHFPRSKVCGGCWNAGGLELLDQLGAARALERAGGSSLSQFRLYSAGRKCRLPLPGGLALSRAASDEALVRLACQAGVQFLPGASAVVGPADDYSRAVRLTDGTGRSLGTICARVVLAADGLGHPSLRELPEFTTVRASQSYLGAGCTVLHDSESDGTAADGDVIEPGEVHMALGREGYVGIVRAEGGTLNVAAALSRAGVRKFGGVAQAAAAILREAQAPWPASLAEEKWHGTPLLTARTDRLAEKRLFLLGDAAGFVEPFTGEGMTWAVLSACALQSLALDGIEQWRSDLPERWIRLWRSVVGSRQMGCRAVAAALRHPLAVQGALRVLKGWPGIGAALARCSMRRAPQGIMRRVHNELQHPRIRDSSAGASHDPGPIGGFGPARDLPNGATGPRGFGSLAKSGRSRAVYGAPP